MTTPLTNSRLRQVLKKATKPQTGWLDVFPAVIGKADGTVQTGTPGIIYVRNILNGQVLTVYNFVVPNLAGLQVEVGRKVETIGLWQVKGVREAYAMPAGGTGSVTEQDLNNLFITWERFLPFLVFPIEGGGFEVQVYGCAFTTLDGTSTYVENQTLDLAAYVPATGAVWVVIEADETGTLFVTEGTEVAGKEVLTIDDIPAVTVGRRASCAVRLYAGQVQLYRDPTTINDFVDLRLNSSGNSGIVEAPIDGQQYVRKDGDWAVFHTNAKYRQFVWVDDGSGGWEFVSSDGEPVLNLENAE